MIPPSLRQGCYYRSQPVDFIFFSANHTIVLLRQTFAAAANPPDLFGGVAHNQCMTRYIAVYNSPSADEAIPSQCRTADNSSIGADSSPLFYKCRPHLVHFSYFCPRIGNIGEDHARAAEHTCFEGYPLVHGNIVLDFTVVSNDDIRADHDILANVAVIADGRVSKYMTKMPYFGSRADLAVVIDDC